MDKYRISVFTGLLPVPILFPCVFLFVVVLVVFCFFFFLVGFSLKEAAAIMSYWLCFIGKEL